MQTSIVRHSLHTIVAERHEWAGESLPPDFYGFRDMDRLILGVLIVLDILFNEVLKVSQTMTDHLMAVLG